MTSYEFSFILTILISLVCSGKGRIIWGINYGETHISGGTDVEEVPDNNIILMSGAEKVEIIEKVKSAGWKVKSVPGAGHKLMKVALGKNYTTSIVRSLI